MKRFYIKMQNQFLKSTLIFWGIERIKFGKFLQNLYIIKYKPRVGDFFIFPAHLQHMVWPFKTDGDYERRSMSFNADFISKTEYEKIQKQQQGMKMPQAPQQSPETLTINTDNV